MNMHSRTQIGYPIILFCVFILSKSSFSQSNANDRSLKFFNRTDAGVSFGIGSFKTDIYNGIQKTIRNDEIVVTLQTTNGVRYLDKIGLGVSFGVEKWQNGWFYPLYGYLSYDAKPAQNTVFGALYLGYAFGKRDSTTYYQEGEGAFALSIGLGYKLKVAKKLWFVYEVFYKYQSLESSYDMITQINDSTYTTRMNYKLPLHFAGFKIGIHFP